MRRALEIGILVAFGGGIVLLAAVLAGNSGLFDGALGPFLTGFALTLLGFLQPVAFTLNWWVTLSTLGLAFWLHHQRTGLGQGR